MSRLLMVATHNKDKLKEISRILSPLGIEVISPKDKSIMENVEENGETFADNALIKARAVFDSEGVPTIADDSGLCIDALGGEPGVLSARFMGEDTSYEIKNAELIRRLEGVPDKKRTARFVCALAFVSKTEQRVFEGVFEGKIGYEARGGNGFGYDPIFYVGDISSSEMPPEQKDSLSHRGKALRKLAAEIDKLL